MINLKQFGQSLSQKALSTVGAGVAAGAMMLGVTGFAQSASAVTIGGLEVTGADTFVGSSGAFNTPAGGTVANALTDNSVFTSVVSSNPIPDPSEFVELGFFNNPVINGSGDDLAFFELGSADTLLVSINGVSDQIVPTFFTNETLGTSPDRNINLATIDLDDFGVVAGDTITNVRIGMGFNVIPGSSKPDLAFVGSISRDVPEPSAMFGLLATAGFFAYQRKHKLVKKA